MRIFVKKFGDVLTSRQSGREAYAAFSATIQQLGEHEEILLDFEGVSVLSPSWADEFLTPLLGELGQRLALTTIENPSVTLTIDTLEGILGKKFALRPSIDLGVE